MKNIIRTVITILSLTVLLSVSIFAVNVDNVTHKHEKNEITIEFLSDNLTKAEEAQIIDYLVTGEQMAMAGNVLCTLFGHSMGATEIITAISHNVYSTAPKCNMDTYGISACTRCDYVSASLLSSKSISCCS